MCLSRDAIQAHVQRHCDGNEVDREFAEDLFCNYRNKSRSKIIATIVNAQIRPPAIKTIVFSTERYISPEQLSRADHDEDHKEEQAESADVESSQSFKENTDSSDDDEPPPSSFVYQVGDRVEVVECCDSVLNGG